eukprot:TRINITY_DN5393_c2_g1_i1.p1 TRINITY_DN5393_c2_g1~~TRINITY_DN5393_c2_g1_i1.p1  ORF type:complete len:280 (+),score=60.76 TRINITY_DN5393_c2_g1_i1:51-842(+)
MAYDFHLSTMLPLTFTFRERAKLSHLPTGKLQREQAARSTLKRALDASNRGTGNITQAQAREAGREELLAVLLGRPVSNGAAESDSPPPRLCQETRKLEELKSQLSETCDAAQLTAALRAVSRVSVDVTLLRTTGIGRTVSDVAKRLSKAECTALEKDTVLLAKKLVARWRKLYSDEREVAARVARDLEKALWADLATDEEVADIDDEYAERLGLLAQGLASDPALRRRSLARQAHVEDVVEAILKKDAADEDSDDDDDDDDD